jgi:hypothetical protein
MTTTYSADTDIIAADPMALLILPNAEHILAVGLQFDRLRILAKAEINRRIWRRGPPVDPSDLSDTTELTEAEVRFVLYYLYRDAASRTGNDLLWVKAKDWKQEAEAEIQGVQLTISDELVRSTQGFSAPIWRS